MAEGAGNRSPEIMAPVFLLCAAPGGWNMFILWNVFVLWNMFVL